MFLCLIWVCILIFILILLCVGMVELGLCWYMWIDFVLDNLVYVYLHKWIDFVCTIFTLIFLGLIFLCSYVWFSGFVWFVLGLCSSVFLMKRMANLNSFILSSNFVFFIFYFVKIDQLIFKIKSWCGCLCIFFNHYFMLTWHF